MGTEDQDVDRQRRVLVHAPVGREGLLASQMLARASIATGVCPSIHGLVRALSAGAGALLLGEEALDDRDFEELVAAIEDQPPWSDLPVLLFAGSEREHVGMRTLERITRLGNVSLLDRPIRLAAVLSAVQFALRSRARQYELREVLVALHEAREQADAMNRVKDEFLATLSHELRTPLNAMLGWASMLRSGQVHGPLVARAHEIIERNARAQHALVADLLDVSRIITGKLALHPSPVAVAPVLMAAVDTLSAAADAKHVTLDTHMEIGDPMVIGDPARLQQVFWNLVSNAVKFTPSGGCVTIAAHVINDQVVISVVDTGIGIDPVFLPAVFDRFRQADSTTTRIYGGLGLGLAISRHIVELHGGRIEARSEGPGRGATFLVWLPQLQVVRAAALPPPQPSELNPGPDLHGVRALVVDDDADGRELLGTILREAGARPSLAASMSEALDLIAVGPAFDVVICDLAMPDRDGYTLIQAIRSARSPHQRGMPAIGFTAFANQPDEAHARKAGFDAFLTKPIEPYMLTQALGSVLRRERVRRQRA